MNDIIEKIRYWLAPQYLKDNDNKYHRLKMDLDTLETWCAYDSPEIGVAMQFIKKNKNLSGFISDFRDGIRKKQYTFEFYKEILGGSHED